MVRCLLVPGARCARARGAPGVHRPSVSMRIEPRGSMRRGRPRSIAIAPHRGLTRSTPRCGTRIRRRAGGRCATRWTAGSSSPAHRRRTDLPASLRQRRRELRPTLARPSQRRLRIAASQRVNQLLQCLLDPRLRLLDAGPSRTRAADPTELSAARFQLSASRPDGRPGQTCRIRHQRIASIPDGTRLRGRPDTTPTRIEKRFEFVIAPHETIETKNRNMEI